MRSASHNQSGSPPSVVSHTTSATALPNLLNSGSPRSPAIAFNPHGSSGGLGALEALVQVATEERRRLSGELPTPLERHESARRASLSPVQNRHPPPLPLPSQSPAAQRSPPLPSPRHEARVSSLGFISLGQSHPHDGEPPSKKRRRTSSVLSGPVAVPPPPAPSLHAPPSPATSASPRPRSISQLFANNAVSPGTLIADPISDLKPPPPLSDPPIAPSPSSDPSITPAAARETEETPQPVEELLAQAAEAEIKPLKDESNAVSATAPTNVPLDVHEEIVKTEESNVSLPALTVHAPDAVPNTVADGVADTTTDAPPVPNTQQPRKRSKEDAHEWLLEHYATDSPAAVPNQHSPPPEGPPDTPEPPAASPLPSAKEEEGLETADSSPAEIHAVKEDASKHEAPSRTHTPLALLEAELNRATSDERIVPSIAISPTSDADLAMELALAADASEQSTSVGRGPSTSNDLDDELLSLVDDKPRQSHLHLHSSAKIAHSPSSSSHVEKPPEAKEGSLKKLFTTPAPRPLSATPAPSESVVMPPPIAPPSLASKSAPNDQQSATKSEKAEPSSASSSMKKKEPSAKLLRKPAQKAKAPAKPKAKAPTAAKPSKAKVAKDGTAASSGRATPSGGGSTVKGKKTTVSTSAAAAAAKRSVSAAVGQSRSRSSSVMPAPPEPASKPQREEEEESEEEVDDKLYCICKTHYDEDKVMIACDRCDEWYHTQCLNMNDLEVDLIDQFVCPPCIEANPHLPLKTTYKQRCFAGLKHPRPSSAAACHKPARGAFSKYCSDECGIAYMQRRIDGWGGDQEVLWASVREVKPREGVVVKISAIKEEPNGTTNSEPKTSVAGGFGQLVMETHQVQKPIMTQYERAITRLHGELYKIAPKREALKKDLEIIMWRQKLLELAAARAERVEECGWDHRLCLDDDEFAEFAAGILESYEESRVQVDGDPEAMQVDGTSIEDGAWWCRGKRKCQRHAGWQKLRALEYEFDQELKEKAMSVLTTQEREIRKQLEDVVSLQARKANMFSIGAPLQPLNGRAPINGTVKAKTNGTGKKGKQRK
ncbi:hypothetical protein BN946_scf184967.g3 [Trametes cinnabarina]|uniref:PHD-type domain-containing protein n=1 Tax=Pycnoporus cinnabarinus TaxID=5643 RepID=A0A060SLH5_PYCCI|nr:hypothetical protein BN946_scf184967.g3 [Trametes cinnabarina]